MKHPRNQVLTVPLLSMLLGFLGMGLLGGEDVVEPTVRHGVVTANVLNVRARPAQHYERIGQFSRGDELTVVSENGDWLEVRVPPDTRAWIASQFLTPDGVVTGHNVRLHSGPGLVFTTFAKVAEETKLAVMGPPVDGWQQVRAPAEATAWLSRAYVRIIEPEPLETVPAEEDDESGTEDTPTDVAATPTPETKAPTLWPGPQPANDNVGDDVDDDVEPDIEPVNDETPAVTDAAQTPGTTDVDGTLEPVEPEEGEVPELAQPSAVVETTPEAATTTAPPIADTTSEGTQITPETAPPTTPPIADTALEGTEITLDVPVPSGTGLTVSITAVDGETPVTATPEKTETPTDTEVITEKVDDVTPQPEVPVDGTDVLVVDGTGRGGLIIGDPSRVGVIEPLPVADDEPAVGTTAITDPNQATATATETTVEGAPEAPALAPLTMKGGVLLSLKAQANAEATHVLCMQVQNTAYPVCYLKSARIDLSEWEGRSVQLYGRELTVPGWSRHVLDVCSIQIDLTPEKK